ncbi:MAG: FAD:protein FMN transferase [Clostridia bacterium]|nr:FAD:protein FMN transferase [Clostridia bacterium]
MKHLFKAALAAFVVIAVLSVCGCTADKFEYSDFFAMNTYVSVSAQGADKQILDNIRTAFTEYEKQLSAHYDGSVINSPESSDAESYQNTMILLKQAHSISEATNGAFDFTLGAVTKLWNITGNSPSVPSQNEISEALSHCGYDKISFSDGRFYSSDNKLSIDLGAIAKGYAGDRGMEILKNSGIANASISVGGNVTVIGSSPANLKCGTKGWKVGIKNPFDTSDILGTVNISDATVSVSGSYERYFTQNGKIYHHIFDSTTGYPAESDLISVAVICRDATIADALSTALFVMGYDKAMDFCNSNIYDIGAVFCTADGRVFTTDNIKDDFIPNTNAKLSSSAHIKFN